MTFYIQSYTTGFNFAMNNVQGTLLINASSTTTQPDQNLMANQIDVLISLLTIQKSFNDLVNSINQQIFKFISTVADANSGILTPLLSTLSFGIFYLHVFFYVINLDIDLKCLFILYVMNF